ncbi:glutathione S-transferase family protein [Sandarakinorhabdus sp.]|uniref:glutathione S-transferase family protein n=1 Tax=Sandarakinorhabdus sp. TaxID=1916663 RepID=UPI00286DE1FD|nr:glutathione S-transferase family protein [Sandarakinorhabdus sp.]
MILYGGKLSPFVMRPLLVSRAKGAEVTLASFEGGIKSPEYLALCPTAKMPLLVDGDLALPESQVIADYLDLALPGPKLVPADAVGAAKVRLLVRLADTYVVPQLGGLFRGREHPAGVPDALKGMGEALSYIEHYRNAADEFAYGSSFSLADAALIPLFFFLDALDGPMPTKALVAAQPGLAAWWERAKASPLGAQAIAEQAEGLKAMMASRAG